MIEVIYDMCYLSISLCHEGIKLIPFWYQLGSDAQKLSMLDKYEYHIFSLIFSHNPMNSETFYITYNICTV